MLALQSTVKSEAKLELSLANIESPAPAEDQVVIRVEAAPINPSDIGPLFAGADVSTATASGSGVDTVVPADIADHFMRANAGRVGKPLRIAGPILGQLLRRLHRRAVGNLEAILNDPTVG